MTTVEAEALDEFDLDIQIEESDLPARKYAPRAQSVTFPCSCSMCCPTVQERCQSNLYGHCTKFCN
jgi:hypothetical protein